MAAGSHPFPSRTRQLSPPAPMVLGGRPPGRVGRRRISNDEDPRSGGGPLSFSGRRYDQPHGRLRLLVRRARRGLRGPRAGRPGAAGPSHRPAAPAAPSRGPRTAPTGASRVPRSGARWPAGARAAWPRTCAPPAPSHRTRAHRRPATTTAGCSRRPSATRPGARSTGPRPAGAGRRRPGPTASGPPAPARADRRPDDVARAVAGRRPRAPSSRHG